MTAAGGRILVIDDEADFAESLADILQSQGHEARVAPGAGEARAAAAGWGPEVALLDLRLGQVSGVDLIPELQAIRPGITCVMLTGYADTEAAIAALQKGAYDFLRKPVDVPVLLAAIGRALDKGRMDAERVRTQAELQESEEKFRSVFHTVPDPVFIARADDGRLLEANEAFLLLSGIPREDVGGWTVSDPRVWVDLPARDRFLAFLRERGEVEDFEATLTRADGEKVHALISARSLRMGGVPCTLGVVRDISSRKRMEQRLRDSLQEKDALLKEVHHRVKSNLQIISGLLAIQSHHVQDPAAQAAYRESQNRLVTMALIHEKLYETGEAGRVEFAGYLKRLTEKVALSHGAQRRGIAVTVEADPAPLSVDTALPCGLILNELLANAFRHGFPPGRRGKVAVAFAPAGGRSYTLRVADDGVGFPEGFDLAAGQRLGLRLVTVLAEGLGARWEIGNHDGTTFTLSFDEYFEAGSKLF